MKKNGNTIPEVLLLRWIWCPSTSIFANFKYLSVLMMMMFLYLADCFSLHLFQFQFISQNFHFSQISHKVTKAVSLLLSLLMNSFYILQKMALWPLKFWLRCWTFLRFLGHDERHDSGGIWKILEDSGGIWMILHDSGGNLEDFRGFDYIYRIIGYL